MEAKIPVLSYWCEYLLQRSLIRRCCVIMPALQLPYFKSCTNIKMLIDICASLCGDTYMTKLSQCVD